jgi:hypothetical protein
MPTTTNTFTAQRDGAIEARLELTHGGTHVAIRAAEIDVLCRAEFDGVVPKTAAKGGRVSIEYPRFSMRELLRHPAHRAEIDLTPDVPWSIAFDGGLGESSADLRELDLRDFQINGGAGTLRVLLPPPRGVVRVQIAGGASNVSFLHPEATAVRLRIAGGSTRVSFDGQDLGSRGGETLLETPGARTVTDRYEIEVLGGASKLTVAAGERPGSAAEGR